jgi:hypothetical protein
MENVCISTTNLCKALIPAMSLYNLFHSSSPLLTYWGLGSSPDVATQYIRMLSPAAGEMPMCAGGCACRLCDLTKMAWHPAFRGRIDEMIHEYKRLVFGPSYFPIEIVDAKDREEGGA